VAWESQSSPCYRDEDIINWDTIPLFRVKVFVQMGYSGDIVLKVESLMEAPKGGISLSFKQIAGRCGTQVDEAAARCFQPAQSTRIVSKSEMQAVRSDSCDKG
jgi:hypothetical protein